MSRAIKLLLIVLLCIVIQACALKPTKEQERETAFNLVFNTITIKTAAGVYSMANLFSFGANKVLDQFDEIAISSSDKDNAFAKLEKDMPEGLMKAIAKIRPSIKDLVFKKPEYIDKFIETPVYLQGKSLAKHATKMGLPDLTKDMTDKQIGLWMHVFMSKKEQVKEIADSLAEWNEKAQKYFDISF